MLTSCFIDLKLEAGEEIVYVGSDTDSLLLASQCPAELLPGVTDRWCTPKMAFLLFWGADFLHIQMLKNQISKENCQKFVPQVPWKKKKIVLKQHEEWIMKGWKEKQQRKVCIQECCIKTTWTALLLDPVFITALIRVTNRPREKGEKSSVCDWQL